MFHSESNTRAKSDNVGSSVGPRKIEIISVELAHTSSGWNSWETWNGILVETASILVRLVGIDGATGASGARGTAGI